MKMRTASIKRDEFVKRVTESRSEELLCPPVEISKCQSNVDLGQHSTPTAVGAVSISSSNNKTGEPVIDDIINVSVASAVGNVIELAVPLGSGTGFGVDMRLSSPSTMSLKSPGGLSASTTRGSSMKETSCGGGGEAAAAVNRRDNQRNLLKQTYQSLMVAVLDPIAYLREKHNFESKVLTKIAKCDGCHGVVWGIHRQALQCVKCSLSIHDKCRELVHENCTAASSTTTGLAADGSAANSGGVSSGGTASAAGGGGSGSRGGKIRRSLKLDDSMLQLELVNRYQDIKSTYPNYLNRVKEVFACVMSDDFRSDIKQTQQSFLQKSVKQIRTRLRIHVLSASDLLAKDSCGTSDPYVTIQCGFSRIKRTRTRKKNLNPVWNETLEFEFVNTADGIVSDSGNCGTKMIVRVWDEDQGLKAQLDKMLTNEQDDFLGQVVLDLNNLNVGADETYRLQPRHDGSHVSGCLVMRIEQKVVETLSNYRINELGSEKSLKMIETAPSVSYLEEYRCLHRHLFAFLLETSETTTTTSSTAAPLLDTTWLLHCFPKNYTEKNLKNSYFKETELNLMLKHFANKYAICEKQKQLVHLECFYTFFFDSIYYQNVTSLHSYRRLYAINCQLLNYTTHMIASLDSRSLSLETTTTTPTSEQATSTASPPAITVADDVNQNSLSLSLSTASSSSSSSAMKKCQQQIIGSFIKKTLSLPLKIVLLLSSFRDTFAVKYRVKRGGRIELLMAGSTSGGGEDPIEISSSIGESAIDELREMVNLFRAACALVQNLAAVNPSSVRRFEQIEAKLANKFSIYKPESLSSSSSSFGYDLRTQYELIKEAIEKSLVYAFYNYFQPTKTTTSSTSSSSRAGGVDDDMFVSNIETTITTTTNMNELEEARRCLSVRSSNNNDSGESGKPRNKSETCYSSSKTTNVEQQQQAPVVISMHMVAERVDLLMVLVRQKLPIEIELNEQLYLSAFFAYNELFSREFDGGFREFCSRILFRQLMLELEHTLNSELAVRMQLDLIKQHLNLHLLIKRFMLDYGLDPHDKSLFVTSTTTSYEENDDMATTTTTIMSLSELFQPFLLEYIRLQEDQFIKYAHKIYDVTRINQLAEEIAHMIEHSRVVLLSMSSLDTAGVSGGANGNVGGTNGISGTGGNASTSSFLGLAGLGMGGSNNNNNNHNYNSSMSCLPSEIVDKYSIDLKSTKAIYDLENFYSASVTDFFTIMHELLQTLLSFDSTDAKANLPHQMGFVNLIKSKLLGYSAHVKKEFQKIYNQARNQRRLRSGLVNMDEADKIYPSNQLTITSCILMNNFQKTIDFLNEIEPKLTSKAKLNRTVVDQLESIRLILKEDLHNMIVEYAHEYEQPLLNAFKFFQLKIYMGDKASSSSSSYQGRNGTSHLNHIAHMKNLIDQSLFNIFNDRFMICKIILFDPIFKLLLEQIFKLTVKCVENSIILSREASQLESLATASSSSSSNNNNKRIDSSEFDSSESSSSSSQHQCYNNEINGNVGSGGGGVNNTSGGGGGGLGSSAIAAAGYGLFNKLGTFFHRSNASSAGDRYGSGGHSNDLHYLRDKSLLNDLQYRNIQQYLKNVVEFFSGDEEFLKKDYLVNTNEYQSALRTLDLYLNSSNQLIASFVRTQNIQQNNIDFRQCFGKVRIQVELKQNAKIKTELILIVRVLEARSVVWCQQPPSISNNNLPSPTQQSPPNSATLMSNGHSTSASSPTTIYMELYAFGPFQTGSRNWPVKIIPAGYVDPMKQMVVFGDENGTAFEFKVIVSSSEAKRLAESTNAIEAPHHSRSGTTPLITNDDRKILEAYEIELVMREIVAATGQTNVIGVSVFNLSETIPSAQVWRRLIREEQMRADEIIDTSSSSSSSAMLMGGGHHHGNGGPGGISNNVNHCSQRIKNIDLTTIGLYANMDLWLPLRPRLKITDYGYKVLKVLDKHASDRRAIEFVKVKSLFRSSNMNNNVNFINSNNFY